MISFNMNFFGVFGFLIIFSNFPNGASNQVTCPVRPKEDIRGPPGIPGRHGEKGEAGSQGVKGEKGDVGQSGEITAALENIKENISQIQNNISKLLLGNQELTQIMSLLKRTSVMLDNSWITPFNEFQYKKTSTNQTWAACRQICKEWGGDLIVHGIRDSVVRNLSHHGLLNSNIWSEKKNSRRLTVGLHILHENSEKKDITRAKKWHHLQLSSGNLPKQRSYRPKKGL